MDWGKNADFKVKHLMKQETVNCELLWRKRNPYICVWNTHFNINNMHTVFDFSNWKRFLRNNQFFCRTVIGNNVMPNRRVYPDITWGLTQSFYPLESSIIFWRIFILFYKGFMEMPYTLVSALIFLGGGA